MKVSLSANNETLQHCRRMGRCLHSNFHAETLIGAGTFGRVLECWDRKHRAYVAIKIVRNVKKYRDAAMIEAGPQITCSSVSA